MPKQTQPQTPAGGPLGDTGDGRTGVPDDEQGISNRPGDRAQGGEGIPELQDDEPDADEEDVSGTSSDDAE